MKTTLTVEQSAELITLGVNPEKASLYPTLPPIFSIADVFSMLPKEIKKSDGTTALSITLYATDGWRVKYPGVLSSVSEELSDALFGMVVQLIENKYVNPTEL